ncbi:MAG: META domain-containing protein [Bacteroidales bacterium]|nr:META domain-containing protein [Porphyromonas sp.]MDD6933971.1 META domain-containing protein [Bacteroidales bacterium]MDY3101969.1 META domain-containing protein [Porphyromonas sp.]
MKRISVVLVSLLAGVALTLSCCAKKTNKTSLDGLWHVVTLNGHPIAHPAGEEVMTLSFDLDKLRLGGMGMCNSYGGNFTLSPGGDFSASNIVSTRVGCEGNHLESALFAAVDNTTKVVLTDKGMVEMHNAEGETIIVLAREAK